MSLVDWLSDTKQGCEGCENRAEIMGAGSWETDATVIFILLFLTAVIIYLVR